MVAWPREQLLTGDKAFGIFQRLPRMNSLLIPDLHDHLTQRPGVLEAWEHLADHFLPFPFGQHHVDLLPYFAVM